MDRKIRVGAVSYLNTKPLIYGLEQGMMKDEVDLLIDYPANIASKLLNNEIDLGLVPVAIIPEMEEHHIISNYCIGCDGEVGSVCLFSEVPINEIETVLLDYQSRTSVKLVKILLKEYWKVNPVFQNADLEFRKQIKGTTAAVVIGDRAFEQKRVSHYCYDLGEAWLRMTGLPFVFAAWVSNKPLDAAFIVNFNSANELGLRLIDQVVENIKYPLVDLKTYYTRFINYRLDDHIKKGMQEFLKRINS